MESAVARKSLGYYTSAESRVPPWARGRSGTQGGGGDAGLGEEGMRSWAEEGMRGWAEEEMRGWARRGGRQGSAYSQQGLGRCDPAAKTAWS